MRPNWERWAETLVTGASKFGSYVLIPALIAVSIYDIVGRQFFNTGSTQLQELEWHFFFAVVMLGLGSTYLQDRHVRIDVISSRLSPKTRAWIELTGYVLLVIPFSLLLIRFGGESAWDAWISNERARAALGLPYRWVIKTALPIGGLLMGIAGTVVCWQSIQVIRGNRDRAQL